MIVSILKCQNECCESECECCESESKHKIRGRYTSYSNPSIKILYSKHCIFKKYSIYAFIIKLIFNLTTVIKIGLQNQIKKKLLVSLNLQKLRNKNSGACKSAQT